MDEAAIDLHKMCINSISIMIFFLNQTYLNLFRVTVEYFCFKKLFRAICQYKKTNLKTCLFSFVTVMSQNDISAVLVKTNNAVHLFCEVSHNAVSCNNLHELSIFWVPTGKFHNVKTASRNTSWLYCKKNNKVEKKGCFDSKS